PCQCRVGAHIHRFEARSTFTRVTACLIAGPPCGPWSRRLRRLRYRHRRSDSFRPERPSCRGAWLPLEIRNLSRRTLTSNLTAADGSASLRGSDAVADKSPSGVSDVRSDRKCPSLMCRLADGRLQLPEKLHGGPGAVRWRSPARDGILARRCLIFNSRASRREPEPSSSREKTITTSSDRA